METSIAHGFSDHCGDLEYPHADLLGTPRLITDDTGAAVGTVSFDAFGSEVAHTGVLCVFGFTGNWTDPDTGLLYLRARDYDPATGQFLSVDPLVDSTRQPYAYVGNNPLTRTDPSGLGYIEPNSFWARAAEAVFRPAAGLVSINNYLDAGDDLLTAVTKATNPVYSILEGWNNAYEHSYSGCPVGTVAMDVSQYWGGAVTLMGIAGGVRVASLKAPANVSPSARSVDDTIAGMRLGKQPHVRTVSTKEELDRVFEELADGATPTTWSDYSGSAFSRTDGIQIGMREGSRSGGATIDIRYPNGDTVKVHTP